MKALLYLFLATLPFQIALNPTQSIDLAYGRVLVLLVFLAWLFWSLKQKKIILPLRGTGLVFLGFFAWASASFFWAQDSALALRKILFLLNFLPLFFITKTLALFPKERERMTHVLMVSGFVAALIGAGQFVLQFFWSPEGVRDWWATIAPLLYGKNFGESIVTYNSWLVNVGGRTLFRAISVFPDPHIFGFYLAFITPLALFSHKKMFNVFGILFLCAVFATFSRAAYIGALGAFAMFGMLRMIGRFIVKTKEQIPSKAEWRSSKAKPKSRDRKIFLRFLSVALVFGLCVLVLFFTPLGSRFLSSFDLSEGSIAGRIEIWTQAIGIIREHPFFGVGLGNYSYVLEPAAPYHTPIYAHNLYLDIAAELGIVGLTLWLVMFLCVGVGLLRSFHKSPLHQGLFISLGWFSVQSFFDTPLFSVQILPLLIIWLALADGQEQLREPKG